ncbi:MAG: hypothetical protein WCQ44_09410 [Opitutaceae bacterium]
MNPEIASHYVQTWLTAATLLDLPLLHVQADGVTPVIHPGAHPRLRCSQPLIDAIKDINATIIADWNGPRVVEGIAYLIYRRRPEGSPDPLYIGIANSANKQGTNHSVLWNIRGARFCDSYKSNGHVDCLSRSLLEGYAGYAPWVAELFGPAAFAVGPDAPRLLQSVYVHIERWDTAAHRVLPITPDAPLYVEEMLRLWALKQAGFGAQLLNRDGN